MNAPDSRAEETRRRLIAAGLELFARHGYDAVTTRQLADAAGVNQAAIPYHFGGKEGVYRAVAEEVATAAGARIRPLAESARLRLAADPEPPALGALLLETTLAVARAVFAGELRGVWPLFLAREQFGQSAAFARLYDEFAGPVHVLVGELIARLTGTPAESPDPCLPGPNPRLRLDARDPRPPPRPLRRFRRRRGGRGDRRDRALQRPGHRRHAGRRLTTRPEGARPPLRGNRRGSAARAGRLPAPAAGGIGHRRPAEKVE